MKNSNETLEALNDLDECPKCKQFSVRAKELWEGGGVICENEECHYWFCF